MSYNFQKENLLIKFMVYFSSKKKTKIIYIKFELILYILNKVPNY